MHGGRGTLYVRDAGKALALSIGRYCLFMGGFVDEGSGWGSPVCILPLWGVYIDLVIYCTKIFPIIYIHPTHPSGNPHGGNEISCRLDEPAPRPVLCQASFHPPSSETYKKYDQSSFLCCFPGLFLLYLTRYMQEGIHYEKSISDIQKGSWASCT